MPSKSPRDRILNFDIDTYLDPLIPPSQLHRLPSPLAHFLGHRTHTPSEPPALISWLLAFLATISGLCLVGGVYNYSPGVAQWNPPPLVASLGASAVLDYNTIRSPLAQPRNTILGHTLSALVAVAVSKGFQQYAIFPSINWVAAAVACATANLVMSVTNTVHPPGGATAILACIQTDVVQMGWIFVPVILLASVLMCTVACLFNNTLRWYPTYWWTGAEVGQVYKREEVRKREEEEQRQREEAEARDLEKQKTDQLSDAGGSEKGSSEGGGYAAASAMDSEVRVSAEGIVLPKAFNFELTRFEHEFLNELQERLRMATSDT